MRRWDLEHCALDGCDAGMIAAPSGEYVLFYDAERAEKERDALVNRVDNLRLALRRCFKIVGVSTRDDVSDESLVMVWGEISKCLKAIRQTRDEAISRLHRIEEERDAFAAVLQRHMPEAVNMSKPPWRLLDDLIAGLKAERAALAARLAEIEKDAGLVHYRPELEGGMQGYDVLPDDGETYYLASAADAVIGRLRDCLERLVDHQNGCPLPSYEAEWGRAMADAARLLGRTKPGEEPTR